jgi:HlyD family secretion protein
MKSKSLLFVLVAVIAGGSYLAWKKYEANLYALPKGFASGNGRVEAIQVDVTTKEAGRVSKIFVREGDLVKPGDVLAQMDTITLNAELARSEAIAAEEEAKLFEIMASIAKAESQLKLAEVEFVRARNLLNRNATSREEYDIKETTVKTEKATVEGEKARLNTAHKSIDASKAEVARIKSRIDDMTLKSTVNGRVLYRLAEEGEVLGNGGKVLTLVNLNDIYMEIYLPAQDAVKTKIGAEARIVLDVAPEFVGRANVTFVAPEAQFTPKQVETRSERDKLMFRVKITPPPDRVAHIIERIKTGIRGVGYVRLDETQQWPEWLNKSTPPPGFVVTPAGGLAPAPAATSGESEKTEASKKTEEADKTVQPEKTEAPKIPDTTEKPIVPEKAASPASGS